MPIPTYLLYAYANKIQPSRYFQSYIWVSVGSSFYPYSTCYNKLSIMILRHSKAFSKRNFENLYMPEIQIFYFECNLCRVHIFKRDSQNITIVARLPTNKKQLIYSILMKSIKRFFWLTLNLQQTGLHFFK